MKLTKLQNDREDLFRALVAAGGEVTVEGGRGGERWFIQGEELLHETWMFCGPVGEPSYAIDYQDLEDALRSASSE